jgi:hypothetical protein
MRCAQRLDTAWLRVVVYDQLLKEMKRNAVLPGFEEAPILFPPTYRYDLNNCCSALMIVCELECYRGRRCTHFVDCVAVAGKTASMR